MTIGVTGVRAWAAAIVIAVAAIGGCDDKSGEKSDSDEESKQSEKKKKKKKKGGSSAVGSSTKYVPAECDNGRVFLNLRPFLEIRDVKSNIKAAVNSLAALDDDAPPVLKALIDGGFDPTSTIQEFAVCASDRPVVSVGFKPGKIKDPLALINDAAAAGGEEKIEVQKRGDVSYLDIPGSELIAFIKPSALLWLDHERHLDPSVEGKGSKGFDDATKNVGFVSVKDGTRELGRHAESGWRRL